MTVRTSLELRKNFYTGNLPTTKSVCQPGASVLKLTNSRKPQIFVEIGSGMTPMQHQLVGLGKLSEKQQAVPCSKIGRLKPLSAHIRL